MHTFSFQFGFSQRRQAGKNIITAITGQRFTSVRRLFLLTQIRSTSRVNVFNIKIIYHNSEPLKFDRGTWMFKGHNILFNLPVDGSNSVDHVVKARHVGTRRLMRLVEIDPRGD